MALTCNRHSFEYAENVCSSCGIAFCHDCLVYPRGPKKPPLCVPARDRRRRRSFERPQPFEPLPREIKKRVRAAKDMQQPQPYVEAPAAASSGRDFELTSSANFDQGWAVSWDEGRDPHPGYPEPVTVTWGNDPFAGRESPPDEPAIEAVTPATPPAPPVEVAPPAHVAETPPDLASAPARPPELPRLQQVELSRVHAPARPGGLPSVRPPLKPAGSETPRTPLRPPAGPPAEAPKLARPAQPGDSAPMPTQQPRVFGGAPATRPDAPVDAPTPPPAPGRLRRKDKDEETTEIPGWLDDLLSTEQGKNS